jgi:hypothetical protein
MGNGFHTDFLYRAMAFGDGKFVAVGGWDFGIATVSVDGGQSWLLRQAFVSGNNFLTGTRTSLSWLTGIAYGKGRFVAVTGDGYLAWSVDGRTWISKSTTARNNPGSAALRRLFFIDGKFYATGDNGTWGISSDGEVWESTGVGSGVISLAKVGDTYYGLNKKVIDAAAGTTVSVVTKALALAGQWTEVAEVGQTDQIFYFPKTGILAAAGYNGRFESSGDFTSWVSTGYRSGPYRTMSVAGDFIVGGGGPYLRSVDAKVWTSIPSTDGSDNSIVTVYATGEVKASLFAK